MYQGAMQPTDTNRLNRIDIIFAAQVQDNEMFPIQVLNVDVVSHDPRYVIRRSNFLRVPRSGLAYEPGRNPAVGTFCLYEISTTKQVPLHICGGRPQPTPIPSFQKQEWAKAQIINNSLEFELFVLDPR